MKFEGIHHISAITGDARRNVDFYTRVLGLRLTAPSRMPAARRYGVDRHLLTAQAA